MRDRPSIPDVPAPAWEAHFDLVFDRSPVGMALLEVTEGACVRVNDALCALLGHTAEELLARTFRDVSHPDEIGISERGAGRLLAGRIDGFTNERRMLHSSGAVVHVVERVGLARDAWGAPLHFVVTLEDISERRQMEFRLQELAERDPLTGLPNRPMFEHELSLHVDRHRSPDVPAALLLLDLDHFKVINDAHGHRVGDELLRRIAAVVRETLPRSAVVARLGGDEFAALLTGCSREEAEALGHRLAEAIRGTPVAVGADLLRTTASVGVVVAGGEPWEAEALLVAADLAMYDAKAEGGDRSVVHDPAQGARERASDELRMSGRLRSALEGDALVLHAQPVVDAVTGEPMLYELLLRLRLEDGELLAPGRFLPHAERFSFVGAIDRWVAARAVELVHEHGVGLAVNLSGRSVGDESLPGFLEDAAATRASTRGC